MAALVRSRPIPRLALIAAWVAVATAAHAQAIPEHPSKLTYPALAYRPPRAADYRAVLPNGVVAYLVPDRGVPLVNVQVLIRTGAYLDPPGKEGLADLAMYELARSGTKTRTAEQLEDRVAFLGAALTSDLSGAGLNLLSKDVDEGLALLSEVLKTPRFQEDRVALRKDQIIQDMKQRNDRSDAIEGREWSALLRGASHWTNHWTTEASIEAITADDLRAFHDRYVGPKNMILAVSGDFDRETMLKKLAAAFSGYPTHAERPAAPPGPTEAARGGWFMVDKDVNQARVTMGLRAIQRDDPDYFPALVMNDILGGGTFTSRLGNRIRSDEGLAYQVASGFTEGVYYPEPWRLLFQSKVRSTAYATQLALDEVRKLRDAPATPEELEISKNGFIEAFPTRFATAQQIATALASEESTGRYATNPTYFQTWRDKVRAVTGEDVQRVARRLLDPSKFTVLIVGNSSDILKGDPKHDASLTVLAGGAPTRLPLRDPLTMKPLPTQ